MSDCLGWVTLLLGHLFDPLAKRVCALKNLKENAAQLSRKTESLRNMKADKERTATAMESRQHQMERSHQFIQWINDVESLVRSSNEFAESLRNRPSLCSLPCCYSANSCGCWSNYKLGMRATELLDQASELKNEASSFTDDKLLIRVVSAETVEGNLKANAAKLSQETESLKKLKEDVESRVIAMETRQHQMKRSNQVSNWFQDVKEILEESAEHAESFRNRPPLCDLSCCASTSSCGYWLNLRLGERAMELLGRVSELSRLETSFTENKLLVPKVSPDILEENLKAHAANLSAETRSLQSLKADIESRVASMETSQMRCSNQLKHWYASVDSLLASHVEFAESFKNRPPFCDLSCCSSTDSCGYWRNYKLREDAMKLLEDVSALEIRGRSFSHDDLFIPVVVRPEVVEEIAVYSTRVGHEEERSQIIHLLKDDDVGIIGVHGMEGIGKTSLLKELNNDSILVRSLGFDIVIWATVPRPVPLGTGRSSSHLEGQDASTEGAENLMEGPAFFWTEGILSSSSSNWRVSSRPQITPICRNPHYYSDVQKMNIIIKIQKYIGERLNAHLSENDVNHNAKILLQSLKGKNFLLVLDDLWMEVNQREIGIPPLNAKGNGVMKKSKMILTSRSRDVCAKMGVKEKGMVEVGLLSPEQSWQLFRAQVVNEELLQRPPIEPLARAVADECGGLPLALINVGRSMSSATEESVWRDARRSLRICRASIISDDFFRFMPALRVLDLSHSHINELPASVGLLTGLRYLDLTCNDITRLPKELGGVEQLQQLVLNNTHVLSDIPYEAISKFLHYCSTY